MTTMFELSLKNCESVNDVVNSIMYNYDVNEKYYDLDSYEIITQNLKSAILKIADLSNINYHNHFQFATELINKQEDTTISVKELVEAIYYTCEKYKDTKNVKSLLTVLCTMEISSLIMMN